MRYSAANLALALLLIAAGLAFGAAGLHYGHIDDSPGAGLIGIVGALGLIVFGVWVARRKTRSA